MLYDEEYAQSMSLNCLLHTDSYSLSSGTKYRIIGSSLNASVSTCVAGAACVAWLYSATTVCFVVVRLVYCSAVSLSAAVIE